MTRALTGLAIVLACVVATGVLLTKTTHQAAAKPEPVLRFANEGISDLYTLDPALGPDFNAREAMQLIFGGLVRFGPGFSIRPDAAARWSVSRNNRIYTFFLRRNVRFADGRLLTARDVAYSLNRTLGQAKSSSAFLLSDIEGATAVTAGRARTATGISTPRPDLVRITLRRADGSFLAKLANPAGYIVPEWRIRADKKGWSQHAIGTGPFMVSRWIHNNALLLAPNPYYYAGKLQVGGVDMPFFPEPLAAYKSYRAGGVDIMGTVHFPAQVLYDVQGRSDFHQSPRLETVFLTLNERRPPFSDRRVRLAFAHALDKGTLVSAVYAGFARPTDGMMPPGLPGYNRHLHGAGYEPQLARRLLSAAGFPRGLPAVVYPVDQDTQSVVLASALARQWRRVLGVRVRLVQYTHSAYIALLARLDYQIAVIDWTDDFPDPENFISQQFQADSPNNNGGWRNPVFDRLTARADEMVPGAPTRFRLYRAAEAMAMNDAAAIPLVNPTAGILLRKSVRGLQITGGYLLAPDWTKVSVAAP